MSWVVLVGLADLQRAGCKVGPDLCVGNTRNLPSRKPALGRRLIACVPKCLGSGMAGLGRVTFSAPILGPRSLLLTLFQRSLAPPSSHPWEPDVAPPRPHRGINIPLQFSKGLFHVKTVKVLGRIYRQNIWFVKTKLLEKRNKLRCCVNALLANNLPPG